MAPHKNQNKNKKSKTSAPPAEPTILSVKPTAPPIDAASPPTPKRVPAIEPTAPPADASSSSSPNPPPPTQESSFATPQTENSSAPSSTTPASPSASPPIDDSSPPSYTPGLDPSPPFEQPTTASLPEDASNALPLPLGSSPGVGERKKKNNGAAKKARRKAKEESRLVDKIKAEREALDEIIEKMQKLRTDIYEQDDREQEHHALLTKKMDEQATAAKEAAKKQGMGSPETLEEKNKLLIQQKVAELSRTGAGDGGTPPPEGTDVPGAGRKRTRQVGEGQREVKKEWSVHEGPALPPTLLETKVPPVLPFTPLGPEVPPDMEANYETEKKEKQRKELEQDEQPNKEAQEMDIDEADKPKQAPGPNQNATRGGGTATMAGLLGLENMGLFPRKTRQPANYDDYDQFPDHPVHTSMDKLPPRTASDDEEPENEAVKVARKLIKGKAKASPF